MQVISVNLMAILVQIICMAERQVFSVNLKTMKLVHILQKYWFSENLMKANRKCQMNEKI